MAIRVFAAEKDLMLAFAEKNVRVHTLDLHEIRPETRVTHPHAILCRLGGLA